MKTIDLGNSVPSLTELLEAAAHENLILRTSEGREFVLAELDDLEQEAEQISANRELVGFLTQRSRETTKVTLEEARKRWSSAP